MLLAIVIALMLGILAGTFTGLFPGIHFNLISVMLISLASFFLAYTTPLVLASFIVAMAITHTTLDSIPGIFLGAPGEDSLLSVLPGHRLLMKGQGYAAAVYTIYGSIIALILIIILAPFFILLLPKIYPYLQKTMGFILIAVVIITLALEKKKVMALIIFLLAGILGIATLNLPIKEPLLPLLTGLFGASGLFASIKQKTTVPEQRIHSLSQIRLSKKSLIKTIAAATIASPATAFLPGLGASQSAIIGKTIMHSDDEREFLFLIGIINTLVMGLSLVTLFAIQKMRTGAAVAVSQLLPEFTINNLFFLIGIIIVVGIISSLIALSSARYLALKINTIEYTKLSYGVLMVIISFVFIFSDFTVRGGILALFICFTATALGLYTLSQNITRIHLMGCLLLPTILYYML